MTTTPRPIFHPSLPYSYKFSSYRLFWDKCTEWLEHEKVKGSLYACHYYPQLPNFTPFCSTMLQLAIFDLQTILRQVRQMTPKWPSTPSSRFPSMVTYFWGSGNFHLFTGYNAKFQSFFFQSLNLKFQNSKRQLSQGACRNVWLKNHKWGMSSVLKIFLPLGVM